MKKYAPLTASTSVLLSLGFILTQGCALQFNKPLGNTLDATTDTVSTATCAVADSTLLVQETYPTYTRWNDYVRRVDPSTACSATDAGAGGYQNCIHAGERRKVELPSAITSCDGITAQDALGAFKWRCDDSTDPVYVYSYSLNDGKGLADLIDPATGTTFLPNSVSVFVNGCEKYKTTRTAAWWTNTLSVAPGLSASGTQTLSFAYRIYTIPEGSSASTDGFIFGADGVAVVTLGDETLSKYGSVKNHFVTVSNQNFAWIEGRFDGAPAVGVMRPDFGIQLNGTTIFSRIHKVWIRGADDIGIQLNSNVRNNLITDSVVESTTYNSGGDNAVDMAVASWGGTSYNTFHKLRAVNQLAGDGVVDYGTGNIWNKISVSNIQTNKGFTTAGCCGGPDGAITELAVMGTYGSGIELGVANNTIGHFTVLHASPSTTNNVNIAGANISLFGGLSLVPSGTRYAYSFGNISGSQLFRSASYTTNSREIAMSGAVVGNDDNRVDRGLWVSSTGCAEAGTGPLGNWLEHNSCNYGSATPVIPPDATTLNMENVILGRVTSDADSPHSTGVAYDDITDFSSLSSLYRGWGKYVSAQAAELHTNHAGPCLSGNDCGIYDVRFSSNASAVSNVNGTFSASACPSSVDASIATNVMTDKATSPRTFLLNAVEILLDDIGNDNGLCESNESCIFAPHVGAYLGEGDYENNGKCEYAGGNGVVNYVIYGYPTTEVAE